MCTQNGTFVALSVPEIIGGTPKIGYAHAPFSRKFLTDGHCECADKFELRNWDNRGTQKILAVPVYAHASFSPKFLMVFCSDGPCECIGEIRSP